MDKDEAEVNEGTEQQQPAQAEEGSPAEPPAQDTPEAAEKKPGKSTGQRVVEACVVVVAVVLVGLVWHPAGRELLSGDTTSKRLRRHCEELNAKCPVTVDNRTRLDRAEENDRFLIYHYTLTDARFVAGLRRNGTSLRLFKEGLVRTAKRNRDLATLFKMNVTLEFHYSDPDGKDLCMVTITPKDAGYVSAADSDE